MRILCFIMQMEVVGLTVNQSMIKLSTLFTGSFDRDAKSPPSLFDTFLLLSLNNTGGHQSANLALSPVPI